MNPICRGPEPCGFVVDTQAWALSHRYQFFNIGAGGFPIPRMAGLLYDIISLSWYRGLRTHLHTFMVRLNCIDICLMNILRSKNEPLGATSKMSQTF